MKKWIFITGFISLLFSLCAYEEEGVTEITEITYYTEETSISEVVSDPVFGDYGRLIFPVDTGYMSGNTLGDLGLAWYSNIRPEKTVEICNYLRAHAEAGDTVFYDIYTDAEKEADP